MVVSVMADPSAYCLFQVYSSDPFMKISVPSSRRSSAAVSSAHTLKLLCVADLNPRQASGSESVPSSESAWDISPLASTEIMKVSLFADKAGSVC